MSPVNLDPTRSALVLIDLQQGILGMPLQPHAAAELLSRSQVLAARCRQAGALVVLVRVAFAAAFADAPPQNVDEPMPQAMASLPAEWSELAPGLYQDGDLVVTKRQWGAFTGTGLDQQLRRRGIDTIVLGGIATNFGVESTARHAWELDYHVVLAEDLCSSRSAPLHAMAVESVFPRIARVRGSAEVRFAGAG